MLVMVKLMPGLTLLMLTDANFASVDTHANADHVDADGYANHVVGIRSNDWIFSGRPGHRSWH